MNHIVVKTEQGEAHGYVQPNGVLAFKNLPFATARRWQAPCPVEQYPEGWAGSEAYGLAPIQPPPDPFWAQRNQEPVDFPQGEDCLNLNVWTCDLERPKKAVLFWVYGGSFLQGYNYKRAYLPENFVKAHPEIVVVAPNYRVGVLGSLNLSPLTQAPEYQYSNNLALMDIVCALKWVQKNIGAFGGDADCITMYGHSAGSNAISHLLVMPSAKGLFRRAICQSSYMTDLGTVALDTSVEIAKKFFELAKVETLEQALALKPDELLAAQKGLFRFQYGGSKASKMFSPVEDSLTVMPQAFSNFVGGELNIQQLMVGGSQGEYDQMFLQKDLEESKDFVIQRNADKKVTQQDVEAFIALHPEMTEKEACMTIHNDLGLSLGGEFIGRACAGRIPVYEYVFRLRDPQEGWRALHGAPCSYVFGTNMPLGAPEHLETEMMDTWAAFINTGDPNNSRIPAWPQYKPDGAVMCIDETWSVEEGYWKQDFAFWGPRFAEYRVL